MKFTVLLLFVFTGCSNNLLGDLKSKKEKPHTANYWYYQDPVDDQVPGIGLYKLHKSVKQVAYQKVIVAILDTGIDIHQPDLKNQFWINNDEVVKNNLDDDANGYIDDIYGWNFLGGVNKDTRTFAHFSAIRFLKKYRTAYQEILKKKQFGKKDKWLISEYQRALNDSIAEQEFLKRRKKYKKWYDNTQRQADSLLATTYNIQSPYKLKTIDSLFTLVYHHQKDETRARLIYFILDVLKNNRVQGYRQNKEIIAKSLAYSLNEKYVEKPGLNDNPIIKYGNGRIYTNYKMTSHCTEVAGAIAAHSTNNFGGGGVFDKAKIMILQITPEIGSDHEKDLANAIYYAVNNGAKVINYSSSINFICTPDLVYDALRYAEKKDVLFITSAGNKGLDLDKTITHPRNNYQDKPLSNFIMVGASDSINNNKLKPIWSNYGKHTIDLFAPGVNFLTTWPDETYKKSTGSSISAAVVSGSAACLRAAFPNLSANDIKNCLLTTVTKYKTPVQLVKTDSLSHKPFNELSVSGGILNVHEAFQKAKLLSVEKESSNILKD